MRAVHVYKLGGPALEDAGLLPALAGELEQHPGEAVVVHGGGRRVDRMLERLGIGCRFVDGRRATSDEAMEVVEMVLSGSVNRELSAGLSRLGVRALGVSGRDAGLISARLVPGLGRVGVPERVDPGVVLAALAGGFVPVVSSVSQGPDGGPVNVNADEAAVAVALAVGAARLVYLSDVDGVRSGSECLDRLDADTASGLIDAGTIGGGMALKVRVALDAARAGVPEVVVAGAGRLTGGFPGTRILAGPGVATGAVA